MQYELDSKISGLILVTGPINSGKSKWAENLLKNKSNVTYIATSAPRKDDIEWEERISIHRDRRPQNWTIIEYPFDLVKTLQEIDNNESILIDSLGSIVENQLELRKDYWTSYENKLVTALSQLGQLVIIVSEETGWGIVPSTKIGHLFRERLTHLSSMISSMALQKWLVTQNSAINLSEVGFSVI